MLKEKFNILRMLNTKILKAPFSSVLNLPRLSDIAATTNSQSQSTDFIVATITKKKKFIWWFGNIFPLGEGSHILTGRVDYTCTFF